jgi:hypothetical protein
MFKFILHSTLVTGSTVLAYTFVESMRPFPEIDIDNSTRLIVLYNHGNSPLEITKFSYRKKNETVGKTFTHFSINKGYFHSDKFIIDPLPTGLAAHNSRVILRSKYIPSEKEYELIKKEIDNVEIKFTYKTLLGDREYIKPIK